MIKTRRGFMGLAAKGLAAVVGGLGWMKSSDASLYQEIVDLSNRIYGEYDAPFKRKMVLTFEHPETGERLISEHEIDSIGELSWDFSVFQMEEDRIVDVLAVPSFDMVISSETPLESWVIEAFGKTEEAGTMCLFTINRMGDRNFTVMCYNHGFKLIRKCGKENLVTVISTELHEGHWDKMFEEITYIQHGMLNGHV